MTKKTPFFGLCFVLFFIFSADLTWAKPWLDKEVKTFLSNPKITKEDRISVLIMYKDNLLRRAEFKSRAQLEQAMIEETQQRENRLLGQNIFLSDSHVRWQTLWIANASLANLNQSQIQNLLNEPEIKAIEYGRHKVKAYDPVKSTTHFAAADFTWGLQKIMVPELRKKYPELDGHGVRVGIVDTGIDAQHPDLKGKVLAFKDFSPAHSADPEDGFGHGTHVAGTIAGGSASGTAIGVAPGASLVIARIFDGNGESTKEGILAAMQWIADPDGKPETNDAPRIVSNSWGDDDPYKDRDPQDDAFCKVVDSWVQLGIIPVFSAGNTGPNDGTINLPGGCPQALTVGATENYDRSPYFSSSGPATWKTVSFVKPEVVAPGVEVYSAEPRGGYQMMSGTSMAAPHVTGALAILLQVKPEMNVKESFLALKAGVKDLGAAGQDNTFGWGRIDVLSSVDLLKKSK